MGLYSFLVLPLGEFRPFDVFLLDFLLLRMLRA